MARQAAHIDISGLCIKELFVLQDRVARRLRHLQDLRDRGTVSTSPAAPEDTGFVDQVLPPGTTITPCSSTNGEEQASLKSPGISATIGSDPASCGLQHMQNQFPDLTRAAVGPCRITMADAVTGYRNATDPWSYSTVPPARYEKPWYQGLILPAPMEVPHRDLRVIPGHLALPNFGDAATGETGMNMEIVTAPDARICTTKGLRCTAQGSECNYDPWNASPYPCPEHELFCFRSMDRSG